MQLEAGLVAALHGNPRRRSHTSQLLRGAALPVVGVVSSSGGSGRQGMVIVLDRTTLGQALAALRSLVAALHH